MLISKQGLVTHSLPFLNHLLSPFRLKITTKNSPNRDFETFIAHLKSLDFTIKTFIDVGVAFGTPAFYKALPQAKFYLVEPVPQCQPFLKKFEQTHNATCFNVAAGAENGEMDFFVHTDVSGSSFHRKWEGEKLDGTCVKVPVRRLDVLIPDSIQRPSLLKIDTQGHELEVLKGAEKLLDNIDVIIIKTSFHEFRKGAPEIHKIIAAMTELGYRCYEMLEGHYRVADNAMAQINVAFVKEDSLLRESKCFFTEKQLESYISVYNKKKWSLN